ncbi:hypothetical protein QAD02_000607 [Eretmocerus hayati]|uniref:Uncharacterized protein n=1 Tax=Eretmocerus hayati TaxID=131215 RepID=A0ACC2NEX8_9HYME|nr:hypothetical protein QAD02_000607 [Eretmocerus hayati]
MEVIQQVVYRYCDKFDEHHNIPRTHEEWQKYKLLHQAMRNGHVNLAKQLLSENPPVNIRFDYANKYLLVTPLHLAVHLGCLDLMNILLNQGASVNAKDIDGETPVMLSVRLRKYSITDLLLATGSVRNSNHYRQTLSHLHIACFRNNISVVKKLIALGDNVNESVDSSKSTQWGGYTPLHFAVESHSVEIVKLLLDNGADIMRTDANSMTPLHLAHEMRNEIIIDVLLKAHLFVVGNPVDKFKLSHFHIACTRNHKDVVEHFIKQGVQINCEFARDKSTHQPIEFAMYYECLDVIKLLLENVSNRSNLFLDQGDCLSLAYEIGNEKIINLLLDRRTMKHKKYRHQSLSSKFQEACLKQEVPRVKSLLTSSEGDVVPVLNELSCHGVTLLNTLVESVPKKIIRFFKKSGADFAIKDTRGLTPLHVLFRKNRRQKSFEAFPSDLYDFEKNPSDFHGLTHFHVACATDKKKLMKKFLENGVNINDSVQAESLIWSGYTALHFAVEYLRTSVIDFLLENGADISLQNGLGLTPFDIAIINLNENEPWVNNHERKKFKLIRKMLLKGEKSQSDFDRRGFSLLHIYSIQKRKPDYVILSNYVEKLPDGVNQAINFPGSKYHGRTALHFAMHANNYRVAKWLLQKGANPYLKDGRGIPPFQYELNSEESFGIIKNNPAVLCIPENPFDSCGKSYFHIGCALGNRKIMEYYIASGVDVDIRTKMGVDGLCEFRTPLHVVINNPGSNATDTIKFLLDHGADIEARDACLNTPLHLSLEFEIRNDIIELLVAHGAEINVQNDYGNTPLHFASENGDSSKVIAFLLKIGADINIENVEGYTPLSYVCEILEGSGYAQDKIVLTLIRHVKKLMLLGLYVSDKNRKAFKEFFELYTISTFDELKFEDECHDEIRKMKDSLINKYTSLYNVTSKSVNEMAYLSQNSAFREMVDSDDLLSNFPIYGYLIKLQYKRGLARKPLLEKCKQALSFLVNLSAESLEKILDYLDDSDLQNIIKTSNKNDL